METSETPNLQEPVEQSFNSTIKPVKQSNSRNWLIAGVALIGTGLVVWQFWPKGAQPTGPQGPPATLVKVQTVQTSPVKQTSAFLGTLEAKQGVVLRPEIEGRVTQIFVSSGSRVSPGQPIVQLSPEKSQADFGAAVANINVATAASSNAQAQLRAVQADRGRAVAELDLQNTEFQRTQTLVKQGVLAKQVLDQVRRDRTSAQAALRAVDEQILAAKANLTQSRASLNQAKASALSAREDVQDTRITAPIAGMVGDIPIKLGSYVQAGDTLTTVIQNQTLELNLNIPIEQRDQLEVGLPVELNQAQSQQMLAKGRISFVSPTVNNESQSVLAKASFANPAGKLRDGQRVEAKVVWQTRPGVLVPTTAVTRLGGKAFVFIADQPQQTEGQVPAMVARQQPVELGSIQGNEYQVLNGIQSGETIVVSGLQTVRDGAELRLETDKPPTGKPPQ
ncbi:efflux RND transporter periplasmic adaptor subunit [Acaryochloris sp. 'Moss Beach']|uniref:efflux RND transporter periplasmic adaptor subunit n=1 Tax=Acaryochloris sp. 'Moss Beach' TaxID=2740837 RepID=UPI001F4698A5|nr:efflux RND transporter periplasmic adaptor subunit [Acaryochloris sp. 'Moss Beach']UJB70742.1 efflux RND transporter periplasmic adaptor subunit [Acaryochloris sp. 'Moss Beach']